MKKNMLLLAFAFSAFYCSAQVKDPVKWDFSARKLNARTYEVHLTAKMDAGWHTYSQTTPEGGPVPTSISFINNPLVILEGPVKEMGKLEQHHEPIFEVNVKQFSNKVDFVQIVRLKVNAKTNITGTIEFMVCNDKECLPPETEKFSIPLN